MKIFLALFMLIQTFGAFLVSAAQAGEYINWDVGSDKNITDIYGQVEVLATTPGTYYCATGWHNSEPGGGYSGVQDNTPSERRAIFSQWDVSPSLLTVIAAAGPQAVTSRFGGEGTGAHSHVVLPWKIGQTVHFYLRKRPGQQPNTTLTSYYYYDEASHGWRGLSSILSPNGGFQSVSSFSGGGLYSFIENFTGESPNTPRVALYRIWAGNRLDNMRFVRKAIGEGNWGQTSDSYFLVTGDVSQFPKIYAASITRHGPARFIKEGASYAPLSDRRAPSDMLDGLKHLPKMTPVP